MNHTPEHDAPAEAPKTKRSGGLRNKLVAGSLVVAGLAVAVPVAVAQTSETPAPETTQDAAPEGEQGRRGNKLAKAVERGTITQEQADAIKEAIEPIKSNEELSREDKREQITAALDELVANGTITQEQLDELKAARAKHGKGRKGAKLESVASAIGVSVDDLRSELQSGKTVAQVAEENGVELQSVIDAVVNGKSEKLAAAVESGRLTQEEADEKIAGLQEKLTERFNNTRPPRGEGRPEGTRGPQQDNPDEAAPAAA